MDVANIALLSGSIVIASKWSEGKPLDVKTGVGSLFLAVSLTVVNSWNEQMARGFAWLILFSSLLLYGAPLFRRVGLIS